MAAGTYNFTIEQGSELNKSMTFYTDATQTSTEDLSAKTMRMQLRNNKSSEDFLDELTDANSRIDKTNAATGVIILKFPAATSVYYDFDEVVYDLEFVTSSIPERILEGVVTLNKEVTK